MRWYEREFDWKCAEFTNLSDSTNDYTQSSTNISNLGTTNNTSIFFLGNFTGLTTSRVLVGPRNAANTNTVTLSAEL